MRQEDEVPMPARIPKYFSILLILLGIIFYVSWVITEPSAWNDLGVYSVTVMFISFGVAGYYLYSYIEKHPDEDEESEEGEEE